MAILQGVVNDVKIAVPDAFFKVIKCIDGEGRTKTTAYIFPNEDVDGKLSEYEVGVEELIDKIELQTSVHV